MNARKVTPEEGREEALRALEEGRFPFRDEMIGVTREPAEAAADDGAVFSAADLTGEFLERCQEYQIPGTGKKLYVFPIGDTDWGDILRWSMERAGPAKLSDDPVQFNLAQQEAHLLGEAYQVILCCRKGPKRTAARCFSKEDLAAVRRYLTREVIAEICRISNSLGGGEDLLGPGIQDFFSLTRSCFATWLSVCAGWDGCPNGLVEVTVRLASLAERALSRGSWGSGMTDELRS